jgi:hypothetical protein
MTLSITHRLLEPAGEAPDVFDFLAEEFERFLFTLAVLPVQTATQKGPGVLRPDGMDVATLRRLSLSWCASDVVRTRYGDDLAGLEMALSEFSDLQFKSFVRGVAVMRGPARII